MKARFLVVGVGDIFLKEDNMMIKHKNAEKIFIKYNIPKVCRKIVIKLDKNTQKTDVLNERKNCSSNAYEIATYAPFYVIEENNVFTGKNYLRDNQYIISSTECSDALGVMEFYQSLKKYNASQRYFQAVSEILSPSINLYMSMNNCMRRVKIFNSTNI